MNPMSRMFYRAMDDDENGGPRCGSADAQLGARVPIDIRADHSGNVHPRTGGMSAAADHPRYLPPHFRPRSLTGGRSSLPCFRINEECLGSSLIARLKKKHALIEPAHVMSLAAYQTELCNTRSAWTRWS